MAEVIGHGQVLQAPAAREAVAHKIHAPDLVDRARQLQRHTLVDGPFALLATEGLVADLRNNNLGGKVVWIMGPAGTWHYYAHLDDHKRGLSVGDYVRKGDLIGYVGNTGNARHTAPHLHYGLYLQGKGRGAVNPYPYLR